MLITNRTVGEGMATGELVAFARQKTLSEGALEDIRFIQGVPRQCFAMPNVFQPLRPVGIVLHSDFQRFQRTFVTYWESGLEARWAEMRT